MPSLAQSIALRPALPEDLPAILAIYNEAVLNTTAVWNTAPADLASRRHWYETRIKGGYPVLVTEERGIVTAYASYGPFRLFDGYRHTAELSIYVAPLHQGKGLGGALLEALIAAARRQKLHVLIAGIDGSNQASLRLHRRHGFVECGRLAEVGRKFDRWLDLVFMQRMLD